MCGKTETKMYTEDLPLEAQSAYKQLGGTVAVAVASAEAHAKASHERFNIFSTLLKESDEVRLHTRFIHCLLDPSGSHDCGPLFLDLFFESLAALGVKDKIGKELDFKSLAKTSSWTVHKEASRPPHGQIDLLLESSGFFGIAIENKIHAGEQTAQLSGYGDYLRRRHGDSFHLIYLTLDGKEGYTAGDHGYLRISYKHHILDWLEACLRATYNIVPVNQVIIQYRAVVRRLTHQTLENEFMSTVLDFIRENPELVRHQNIVTQAVNAVRAEVLDGFAAGIIKAVMEFAGDAKINPSVYGGRFGLDPCGSLWITPHPNSDLLKFPFHIWLEIWNERILLGMKVPDGRHRLDADTQLLLAEMNRLMTEDKERSESRVPWTNNGAWPTGWDEPVKPLNDGVIADWMRLGMDSEIARVSEAIRSHISLLERAYTAAKKQISGAATADRADSKANTP
jgi:hypothetical protein